MLLKNVWEFLAGKQRLHPDLWPAGCNANPPGEVKPGPACLLRYAATRHRSACRSPPGITGKSADIPHGLMDCQRNQKNKKQKNNKNTEVSDWSHVCPLSPAFGKSLSEAVFPVPLELRET